MDKQGKPVPGADYVTTKKTSRRKKKTASKDETSEAGPSSSAPSQTPLQALPSPTTVQAAQPPASTDSRQSRHASSQHDQEMLSTLSISTPVQTSSAGKSKSAVTNLAELAAAQMTPVNAIPNRGLAGSNDSKPVYSTGGQSGKSLPVTEGSSEERSIKGPTHTASQAGPSNVTRQQHQTRPGGAAEVGSQGTRVFLSTNYFSLTVEPGRKLHRYSIEVCPEVKGRKLGQMINDALRLPEFDQFKPGMVSDFAAVLLSQQKLPNDLLKISVGEAPNKYYVTLDLVKIVDLANETNLQENSPDLETLPIVQDLEIVLGHHRKCSQDVFVIGKRRAFPTPSQCEDGGSLLLGLDQETALLGAVRGFFSSVRLSTTKILVNVNVTHGAFYITRSLQDWLSIVQNYPDVHATKIPGLLKGLQVKLQHIEQTRVIRTISGYALPGQGNGFEAHPPRVSRPGAGPGEVEFFEYKSTQPVMSQDDKDKAKKGRLPAHNIHRCGCAGSYISVLDYFRKKYPKFPCPIDEAVVNVGNAQHPSYLPLSACWVIYQPAKWKLRPNEQDIMHGLAVRVPYDNAKSIKGSGFRTLGLERNHPKLRTLGIDIDPKRMTLWGRELPQPDVMFNEPANYKGSQWNLANIKFRSASRLEKWACVTIHRQPNPETNHSQCLKTFVNVLRSCGIDTTIPNTTHIRYNRVNTELESVFERSIGIKLLLVVLPEKNSQLYNLVKRLGDVKHGIPTICVAGSRNKFYNRFEDRSKPYYASVALKVNIKAGGINHVLKGKQLGFIGEGDTMVIGIDVTHPSPGSGQNALSVAAMVASSDKFLAQWPAEIRINPARQEKVDSLHSMLRAHLLYWEKKNGSLPGKLLIYRDGVSEGQYQMVLDEELPNLRRACQSVYGEQQPLITLIVVGKRHHTRFYSTNRRTGEVHPGMDGNPRFGTVVDSVIVDQERNWDFYIQSHTALHGTARPAHYFVLVDEIFKRHTKGQLPKGFQNPSDLLYMITYNMCYLSCRSITSVSIPPPVYYADIACERARRWNSRVFDPSQSEVSNEMVDGDVTVHDNLEKTMFYI